MPWLPLYIIIYNNVFFFQYCVVPLCFCAPLVILELKPGHRTTTSQIKLDEPTCELRDFFCDVVGDIVGLLLLYNKAINIHLMSLQCAPWKLECYTISRVIDPWQLCSKKKRNETTVGYFSGKYCFTIKLHTHASFCGNHLHCLFWARKMLKTVDRKNNLSSQASFTDHSKNSRKGLAVRQRRPGVTLYLTQALWYVMGVHLSLSSSPPPCSSPTHASYRNRKCGNTAHQTLIYSPLKMSALLARQMKTH